MLIYKPAILFRKRIKNQSQQHFEIMKETSRLDLTTKKQQTNILYDITWGKLITWNLILITASWYINKQN